MNTLDRPQIIWPRDFDERAEFEIPLKGWLSVQVQVEDGRCYSIYFSDPFRLQQDLDENVKLGRLYFTEPGLIILPEVTVAATQNAVQSLWEQGFFAHLKADQADGLQSASTLYSNGSP